MVARAEGEHGVMPQLSAVVVFTSATLPLVALKSMLPITSDGGNELPKPPAPACSWMRKYWPGATLPDRVVTWEKDPTSLAYCTDQPVSDWDVVPLLKSSMKSFVKGEPIALPPPP